MSMISNTVVISEVMNFIAVLVWILVIVLLFCRSISVFCNK